MFEVVAALGMVAIPLGMVAIPLGIGLLLWGTCRTPRDAWQMFVGIVLGLAVMVAAAIVLAVLAQHPWLLTALLTAPLAAVPVVMVWQWWRERRQPPVEPRRPRIEVPPPEPAQLPQLSEWPEAGGARYAFAANRAALARREEKRRMLEVSDEEI